jgi:hypothetical protein
LRGVIKYPGDAKLSYMTANSNEGVVRVEKHKTSDGKEFSIARKPRPGRQCQTPQKTGKKLECPYCSEIHDEISYVINKGLKSERIVKSWECPIAGKVPLNRSKKFQEYIAGITIRSDSKSMQTPEVEGQKKVSTERKRNPVKDTRLHRHLESRRRTVGKTLQEFIRCLLSPDNPSSMAIQREVHTPWGGQSYAAVLD